MFVIICCRMTGMREEANGLIFSFTKQHFTWYLIIHKPAVTTVLAVVCLIFIFGVNKQQKTY